MEINVKRYSHGENDTLGLMFIDCEFVGYTLEDEYRNEKVYGKTRIPDGVYSIGYRKVGGFHSKYSKKFPNIHKGMIQINDVPNFEYILLHIGNDHDDTAGCILVGNTANYNKGGKGVIGNSTGAYKRIYPLISDALENGEKINITIENL